MTKTAFIFPGQGSQKVGMLDDFADISVVTALFQTAHKVLGYDLWALCANGPESDLNTTTVTQPALLTTSVALSRFWQEKSEVKPNLLAGHSLGEYSALVVANAIGFEDALSLVKLRAELMQSAVPTGGAMAAVLGLDKDAVIAVCEKAQQGQVVSAANFNSPQQTVIAGEEDAVDRAIALAKEDGAKRAMKLAVSVPSHCALMKDAADKMTNALANTKINQPEIPVIHNVDVDTHNHPDDIRQALLQQLHQPVRWTETVEALVHEGVTKAYECGPGNVLQGLVKRIDKSIAVLPIGKMQAFEEALA